MKRKLLKKGSILFLLVLLLIFLPACGKKNGGSVVNEPKEAEEAVIFQDIKEEIQVILKNGKAQIAYAQDDFSPQNISGLKEKITDVKIAYVERIAYLDSENYDQMDHTAWPEPSVFLLLENGQVAWLLANPDFSKEAVVLPFLENIEGLYLDRPDLDPDHDYYGIDRVYAEDDWGDIYYLEHPVNLRNITQGTWIAPLTFYMDEIELSGYLKFMEEGQAEFAVAFGWTEQDTLIETWYGDYEFILAEDQAWQPMTLLLNFDLGWWIYEAPDDLEDPDFGNDTIRSVWWAEFGPSDYMGLFNSEGDTLFKAADDDFYYAFWQFEDLEFD